MPITLTVTPDGIFGPTGRTATLSMQTSYTSRGTVPYYGSEHLHCFSCATQIPANGYSVVTSARGRRGRQRYGMCCVEMERVLKAGDSIPGVFAAYTIADVLEHLEKHDWTKLVVPYRINDYDQKGPELLEFILRKVEGGTLRKPREIELAARSPLHLAKMQEWVDKIMACEPVPETPPTPAGHPAGTVYRTQFSGGALPRSMEAQVACDWCGSVQRWGDMHNWNCLPCNNYYGIHGNGDHHDRWIALWGTEAGIQANALYYSDFCRDHYRTRGGNTPRRDRNGVIIG